LVFAGMLTPKTGTGKDISVFESAVLVGEAQAR
jgi:hypothetical protein